MSNIQSLTCANDLPIHKISLPGTRTLTALVAFDAGARTERPEENGIAHFLEHLVFKGGEIYDDYRKVNETAERMGGMLNAFTSHSMVAFHITVRGESAPQALDLLTDFVGRPTIDQVELDKERGVVIQEINRYNDEPSAVAEHLIDQAAFGDHPLGRPILGPASHIETFTRQQILDFRNRQWAGGLGGVFLVGDVSGLPNDVKLNELFSRFPSIQPAAPSQAAPGSSTEMLVEERDTNQSHLRICYRPKIDVADRSKRAALSIYTTLLGGSMGSRLFDEIREQRGLAYSVGAGAGAFGDGSYLQLSAGLDSSKCTEAYTRMREIVGELHSDGPTEEEVQRARAYSAGRMVLGFESSGAVARYAASQLIVQKDSMETDSAIESLDNVTYDDVVEICKAIDPDEAAVACVGPHSTADFAWNA